MRTELHGMLQKLRDSQDCKRIKKDIYIYLYVIYTHISRYTLTGRHAQNYTLKVKYPVGSDPEMVGSHRNLSPSK